MIKRYLVADGSGAGAFTLSAKMAEPRAEAELRDATSLPSHSRNSLLLRGLLRAARRRSRDETESAALVSLSALWRVATGPHIPHPQLLHHRMQVTSTD